MHNVFRVAKLFQLLSSAVHQVLKFFYRVLNDLGIPLPFILIEAYLPLEIKACVRKRQEGTIAKSL